MSSRDVAGAATPGSADRREERETPQGVRALLDVAFGHFIWAGHFLVVYIATAVSCQLGLGAAGTTARTTFIVILVVVTLAAAALVALHAARRYHQLRELPERQFRMTVTIGNDAVALVGILWQLYAILLVPLCA